MLSHFDTVHEHSRRPERDRLARHTAALCTCSNSNYDDYDMSAYWQAVYPGNSNGYCIAELSTQ